MGVMESDSDLDIDHHRWYFTKFSLERYRHEWDWETVLDTFERTAEATETLLEAYQSAGVFGGKEMTALKSLTQFSGTIGPEATRKQILATDGDRDLLDSMAVNGLLFVDALNREPTASETATANEIDIIQYPQSPNQVL